MKMGLRVLALSLLILSNSCLSAEDGLSRVNVDAKRQMQALAAIKQAYGKSGHEYDVTLFVTHHLEELDTKYWIRVAGKPHPSPRQVLGVLVLMNKWKSDGQEIFDFSLPGDVTQYVLSVKFEDGIIREISMES
ncbi:MAG TPA: DUF2004 domain-containing protein [Gallionellaceae bacterium]